jgi:lysophospholipase L1-like esterase
VYVSTVNGDGSSGSANWINASNYNTLVRSDANGWWHKLADPGLNSPYERRLNDSSDTTYFDDSIHPNNTGYDIIAGFIQQTINPHRRALW